MTKQITQGLGGVTLGVIVAVTALLLLAGTALAAGSVSGSSETVAAGGNATVTITATAGSGHGIGNWTIDVAVDAGDLGTPTCTNVIAGGSCNVISGNVVRFAGADGSASGLTGDQTVGTIAVTAGSGLAAGDCSDLTITVSSFDDEGGNALNPSPTNGKVCVAAATATPAPTASPTPKPSTLPNTGGNPGSGPSSAMTWLLVAAGLVVVSGGAWALSRARREI